MRILIIMFLTVGIAASACGGSYVIDYQQQIDGAEDFVHIDPVVDESGQPESFLFCHENDTILTRYYAATGLSDSLHLPRKPLRTINHWKDASLHIYVLSRKSWFSPMCLGLMELSDTINYIETDPIRLPYRYDVYGVSHMFFVSETVDFELHFARTDDPLSGVIASATVGWVRYEETMGPSWGTSCISNWCSPDLSVCFERPVLSTMELASLTTDSAWQSAGYSEHAYGWNFQDYANDPNHGDAASTTFFARDTDGSSMHAASTSWGNSQAVFAEDFFSGYPYDEVIYYAYANDIMGLHGVRTHIACYDFSTGSPIEIWYQPLSNVSLDYVYHPGQLIAGRRGSMAIFLDYTTGLIVDSVQLDRHLANPLFFETSNGLSLTGRVYDTVFVYTFDTPTDISDGTDAALPEKPQLHQNYPNPFNPSTTIEFSLPRRSAVTVTVYNVLGQRVNTLVDRSLTAGNHRVVWAGVDQDGTPVVSGVYFYRITTDNFTATKKMVLVR